MKTTLKENIRLDNISINCLADLREFFISQKGKIVELTSTTVTVNFGNILVARLFGMIITSWLFERHIPYRVTIEIDDPHSMNVLVEERLGILVWTDPASQKIYRNLFNKVFKEIKKHVLTQNK